MRVDVIQNPDDPHLWNVSNPVTAALIDGHGPHRLDPCPTCEHDRIPEPHHADDDTHPRLSLTGDTP